MSLSVKSRKQLRAIRQVEHVSQSLRTTSWIWGGFTTDIYMGRILREHDDLDHLTLNLHQWKENFAEVFSSDGWQTQNLANGDLGLKRDGVKVHLGNVELDEVARWTHNGEKGSLIFPVSWLCPGAVEFCGVVLHVIAPELQFVLKERPGLLNPDWVVRDKDLVEKEYLQKILLEKNVEICSLPGLVMSI